MLGAGVTERGLTVSVANYKWRGRLLALGGVRDRTLLITQSLSIFQIQSPQQPSTKKGMWLILAKCEYVL